MDNTIKTEYRYTSLEQVEKRHHTVIIEQVTIVANSK